MTANATDGGTLSYQWYRNTKNSVTGATAISGAGSADYWPDTASAGTTYYFCRVTNTNAAVSGAKTASVDSKIAAVKVEKAANPITKVSSYRRAIGSRLTLKPAGKATYKSANKKVAAVSRNGRVTFKNFGTTVITVNAKGNDSYKAAVKRIKITVTPKKATVRSLNSVKSGTLTVKWKKDTKATGYQIQYAANSKFKKAKSRTVKGSGTTSLTIRKLTGKRKYYVRVREYRKVVNKKIYGDWSKVRNVKVRK